MADRYEGPKSLEEWFAEEAEWKNKLGQYFRESGKMVKIPDQPPELNRDGSTKKKKEDAANE